jgi:hypothetical protein
LLLHPGYAYLVGFACLWVAAKLQDVVACPAQLLLTVSGIEYTKKQLVGMEARVLRKLKYDFNLPTAKAFLDEIMHTHSRIAPLAPEVYSMACYLCDLSLLDYSLTTASPSRVAAAAYALAHCLVQTPSGAVALPWLKGDYVTEMELHSLSMLHANAAAAATNGTPWVTTQKYMGPEYYQVGYVAALPAGVKIVNLSSSAISCDTTYWGGQYSLFGSTASSSYMQQIQQQQPPPAPAAAAEVAPFKLANWGAAAGTAATTCPEGTEPEWVTEWYCRNPLLTF